MLDQKTWLHVYVDLQNEMPFDDICGKYNMTAAAFYREIVFHVLLKIKEEQMSFDEALEFYKIPTKRVLRMLDHFVAASRRDESSDML